MTSTTATPEAIDTNGTHLVGYLVTTYNQLLQVLGPIDEEPGEKVNVLWARRNPVGTVYTIYDWKQPTTPLGPYRWHVGGHDERALIAAAEATGCTALPISING